MHSHFCSSLLKGVAVAAVLSACGFSVGVQAQEAGRTPPLLVKDAAPIYPPLLAARKVQGWVDVSVHIDAKGNVEHVDVVDSQPKGVFDKLASKSAREWKFQPATENGQAVPSREARRLVFSL